MIGAKDKKKTLGAIFVTFGISTLAATILFPILAHIFLSHQGDFIMGNIPGMYKGILLGLFLASFPFAQFICNPIMGDYSDKKGRRWIFLLSVLLEALGYILCALAMHLGNLLLLFIGRIITGVAAGNTSVCLATIVDLSSEEKEKVRYFSIGSAVIGLMFVLGPLIGGRISAVFSNPVYALAMPMWIGAIFAVFNFLVLLIFLKETKEDICSHKFDILGSIHNMQLAFRIEQVKDLYLIYFFFLFAWNMIYQFLPAFLVEDYHMSSLMVGTIGAFFGCVWIVGTLFMQKVAKHFRALHQILFFSLIAISLLSVITAFTIKIYMFVISICVIVFLSGGMWPIFTAAISKSSEQGVQGKVLALSQSIQSFSMLLAPLIGGFFIHNHAAMPFVLTAISVLFAAAILVRSGKEPFVFNE